jgi:hypothetical protein
LFVVRLALEPHWIFFFIRADSMPLFKQRQCHLHEIRKMPCFSASFALFCPLLPLFFIFLHQFNPVREFFTQNA